MRSCSPRPAEACDGGGGANKPAWRSAAPRDSAAPGGLELGDVLEVFGQQLRSDFRSAMVQGSRGGYGRPAESCVSGCLGEPSCEPDWQVATMAEDLGNELKRKGEELL